MMEISLMPRNAQSLHSAFCSRNFLSAILEDSSNDGFHSSSHRARVDCVPLRLILIDTFCQAYGEASLRKIDVRRFLRYGVVYLT